LTRSLETLPSGERPKKIKKRPPWIYSGRTKSDDSIKTQEFVQCLLGRPLKNGSGIPAAPHLLTAEDALQTAAAFLILM